MTGRRRSSGGSHHSTSGSHHTTRRDSPDGAPDRRRSGGGDGVGLNADSIDTMAGRLDATRSRVDGVGDTVRGVNVGPQSMGIVGSAFTGAAQQHLRTAEQHVTRTSRAVEQAQRGTRGTVQAYRDTDTTNAANLSAIDTTTKPPEPRHADPTTRTPTNNTGGNDPAFGSISGTLDDSGPTRTPGPPKPPRISDAEWDAMSTPDKIAHAEAEVAHNARTFRDNDEASEYGAREWNDYAENLPQSQKDSIHNYTRETEYPNYKDHNGYLRGSEPGTPEVLHDIAEIDKAMAGHPVPEDVVVTRGTNLGHLGMDAPDMVGQTFHDPAYMSTSLGGPAGAFDSKEAILHLNVPAGTPALWVEKVSAFGGGERELLLGRGMSYRVDRVVWEGGQWQIYGQIIPPK
jgi:hypothetical protein